MTKKRTHRSTKATKEKPARRSTKATKRKLARRSTKNIAKPAKAVGPKDRKTVADLTKTMNAQMTAADEYFLVVERNHNRCVRIGHFFDIAQPPKMTDVEIVVCFCDIRGFTAYTSSLQERSLDNRVQNFLKEFLKIFSLSILETVWKIEPNDPDEDVAATMAGMRDLVVPATYKNLGDGMMIVWEIPPEVDRIVHRIATRAIFYSIIVMYRRFYQKFSGMSPADVDSFSSEVENLGLGFGVARGHAWKLDFGHHLKSDYAGSIVNLASRLLGKARPGGIVCHYELSQALFEQSTKIGIGTRKTMRALRGLPPQDVMLLYHDDVLRLSKTLTVAG